MRSAAAILGLLTLSAPLGADGGQYTTQWRFTTSQSGFSTTYGPMDASPVVMPLGSPWRCSKRPISNNRGGQWGGFVCNAGEAVLLVSTTCALTKIDTGHAFASVGYGTDDLTYLEVTCTTTRAPGGGGI